jgi:hypothetical protein
MASGKIISFTLRCDIELVYNSLRKSTMEKEVLRKIFCEVLSSVPGGRAAILRQVFTMQGKAWYNGR